MAHWEWVQNVNPWPLISLGLLKEENLDFYKRYEDKGKPMPKDWPKDPGWGPRSKRVLGIAEAPHPRWTEPMQLRKGPLTALDMANWEWVQGVNPWPLISMNKMSEESLKHYPRFADRGKPKPLNWPEDVGWGPRSKRVLGLK